MQLRWVVLALTCLLIVATLVACAVKPASIAPASPTSTAPVSESSEGLVEKLTLEELTTRSVSILVGQVTSIVSHEEGKGNIYTVVTLSVEQVVKGESASIVAVRVRGGEVNGQQMWVEDAPRFQAGERVLVFLEGTGSSLSVVGGVQGKLAIDKKNMVGGNSPLTIFIDQIKNILV